MSPIEAIKAEASALRLKEKSLGRLITHSEALELVAKNHGYESWRACRALLAVHPPGKSGSGAENSGGEDVRMRRYVSSEWNFGIDVPANWNSFPPVSANSPFEVVRFMSNDGANQALIIFRWPRDPKQPLSFYSGRTQAHLAEKGYENFSFSETRIGKNPVLVMDFDKLRGDARYSSREYFVAAGTLGYTLGFGTSVKEGMFEVYDRMAMTFEFLA